MKNIRIYCLRQRIAHENFFLLEYLDLEWSIKHDNIIKLNFFIKNIFQFNGKPNPRCFLDRGRGVAFEFPRRNSFFLPF